MRLLALASLALLAACAGTPSDAPVVQAKADLASFARADLEAAYIDALNNKDAISAPCWRALADAVGSLPAANAAPIGAFTAFQKARDVRGQIAGGVPMAVKLGCGPLVVDEQTLLLRLGVIAAGTLP